MHQDEAKHLEMPNKDQRVRLVPVKAVEEIQHVDQLTSWGTDRKRIQVSSEHAGRVMNCVAHPRQILSVSAADDELKGQ